MTKFTLLAAFAVLFSGASIAQDRVPVNQNPAIGARSQSVIATEFTNSGQLIPRNGNSAINVAFSDDFSQQNDTSSLIARGYLPYYRGTGAQGISATWFQPDGTVFPAYNGAISEYVAANYNVVTATNNIDSWLVTPALNVASGDKISFYARSVTSSTWVDSIRVMYSAAGDSTPEGLTWVELGRFQASVAGTWDYINYAVTTTGATARFAIRYAVIDGGPNGSNSNFIGVDQLDIYTPQTTDASVFAISSMNSGCGLSATTPVDVSIFNWGGSAISGFPVSFVVDNGTPVTETFTGTIPAGGSSSFLFTGTADFSAVGPHTIKAYSSLSGDGNAANDTTTATVTNIPPIVLGSTAVTEGFEAASGTTPPPGWTIEDTDGDGNIWDFATTYTHNGLVCARLGVAQAMAGTPENWLFSPCLDLTAGTNYKIEYWYKSFTETATSYQLELRYGNAATGAAMTNNIAVDPLFTDSTYHLASHTFTPANSGVYNIGINGFGSGVDNSIRVDDASMVVVTGIKETDLSSNVTLMPNPATTELLVSAKLYGNSTLTVYNQLGQEVIKQNYNEPFRITLDIQSLKKGVYTLKISNADGVVVNKFVKQ